MRIYFVEFIRRIKLLNKIYELEILFSIKFINDFRGEDKDNKC